MNKSAGNCGFSTYTYETLNGNPDLAALEPSQLISSTNQLTGFYMREALVVQ